MHKFSVSKDMKKIDYDERRKKVVVGKLLEHLCLTLIIKGLKLMLNRIEW